MLPLLSFLPHQGTYNQWQARVHYYHWLKVKRQCQDQGFCEMGGFTRLL